MYVNTSRKIGTSGAEYTRSFRTGHGLARSGNTGLVSNPPIRRKGEGSLAFERRKNDYYRNISLSLKAQPKFSGVQRLGDFGHEYINMKCVQSFGTDTAVRKRDGKVTQGKSRIALPFMRKYYRVFDDQPSLGEFGMETSINVEELTSLVSRNDFSVVNAVNSSLPIQSMGWGETIFELASGNFPSLISKLGRRIARGRLLDPKGSRKDLGSDYLNARFGIEPILNDTLDLIKRVTRVDDALYGTYKRYRSTPLISESYETRVRSNNGGAHSYPAVGRMTADSRLSLKFAKVYRNGTASSFRENAEELLWTFGVNPKLTWDIIPFSFLVDWFASIGKSINIASQLNPGYGPFTMIYGWETVKYHMISSSGTQFGSSNFYNWHTTPTVSSCIITHRRPISPYGVKFAWPKLTPYQWSILVSLGFAK